MPQTGSPWRAAFPSRDLAEHAPDRHSDAGDVAATEDVARHDFAGREDVLGDAAFHVDARALVHLDSKVCEGDARPKRICVKRRRIEPLRPVRLVRDEALGAAVVQSLVVECAGRTAALNRSMVAASVPGGHVDAPSRARGWRRPR